MLSPRTSVRTGRASNPDVVTARNIAKQCGILSKGGIVMEGSEFRRLTLDQMDRLVPNLEVLARSSPTDKQLLVSRYAGEAHAPPARRGGAASLMPCHPAVACCAALRPA